MVNARLTSLNSHEILLEVTLVHSFERFTFDRHRDRVIYNIEADVYLTQKNVFLLVK